MPPPFLSLTQIRIEVLLIFCFPFFLINFQSQSFKNYYTSPDPIFCIVLEKETKQERT
jgi:hypothetical protein